MIKNIFLPDQIGNNYLFAKRIAGIYIGKIGITASIVYLYGTKRTVERTVEVALDGSAATDSAERTIQAIRDMVDQIGAVHEIHTALPSSIVVFKELRLPFASHEKIALIVPFEVEPLLPFALNDTIIDFIITRIDQETKHAHVLVAAVQKKHISHHLELFAQAGVNPARISVDLFDLYSMLKTIPTYGQSTQTMALIHIGLQDATIAYLDAGQLRFIRTLQKGMITTAKYVGDRLQITPAQAMDHIMRFGTQETDWPEYKEAVKQALSSLCDAMQFTISSFATQAQTQVPLESILVIGAPDMPKGMLTFIHEFFKIPIIPLETAQIAQIAQLKNPEQLTSSAGTLYSIALALPTPISESFNLRKKEFEIISMQLLYKQLIAVILLSLTTVISLGSYSYIQLSALSSEATSSEQEATTLLTERFKQLEQEGGGLEELIDSAKKVLQQEKKTWAAFSAEYRASYLRYLLELTTVLDKEALGLELDKITFTENFMILKGKVKDYEALNMLRHELLKSALFVYVERENNPQFEALKVTLAHAGMKEPS